MLSLRQLQQFLAVADTMNFHRAAERLNMAQPPLTAAIRQIEEMLGVRLFERTNRITGLTRAGLVLQDEAGRTIRQAERAMLLARRAGEGLTGSLRIGFVASAVRHLLPKLVAGFRKTHPDVALELAEAPTARQVESLFEDRLDVGIVVLPLPVGADRLLTTRILRKGQFVAALPHGFALSAASSLTLAHLAGEPWILFPENQGPGLHRIILNACAKAGFTPEVAQRAVQMETILGLVSAGLGVALVPDFLQTGGWDDVDFRPLAGSGTPVPYEIALTWRKDDDAPALAAFISSEIR
ncbi:LysR family transcriptional regulator [Telmatospirillum sp.]|uniref:LysR family transcriptional regulator n=1 Tax=Telmatospirillum sp. TaxID=2079197 RepID=UPI00284299C8|nr:LysR family transcriptional regulator [Telmatospirillum sp.]MDR3436560.1 LysR family transcriptional regulator [Telmatospirillum sp.]